MQAKTRKVLWDLSENPAGVILRFTSTATKFTVRYEIEGKQEFPHMPATGVSGLDLYIKENKKNWQWVKGNYHFSDTISYTFQLSKNKEKLVREFMLYLPLYATLKSMEIGFNSE